MDKRLMMASAGQVRTQPTFERATLPGMCVCAPNFQFVTSHHPLPRHISNDAHANISDEMAPCLTHAPPPRHV